MLGEGTYGIMLVFQSDQSSGETTAYDNLEGAYTVDLTQSIC